MSQTVQEHYDYLGEAFEDGVRVNMINPDSSIEFDMGDSATVSDLVTASSRVQNTLEDLGYTPTSELVVSAGYRGACNEALVMTVEIAENPYKNGIGEL